MPNHGSMRMNVRGEKAERDRFKAFIAGPDEDGVQTPFCFEKIIPYPAGFDKTVESGSTTYDIKKGDMLSDAQYEAEHRARNKEHKWGRTEEQLQEEIAKAIKIRAGARKNIEVAGHPTWYEWNIEHWGTKWGAYSVEMVEGDDDLTIEFQTAWSLPEPIFDALAVEFPKLGIVVLTCEEGGFFCGTWKKSRGRSAGKFYDTPYPEHKEDQCPYHGTHDWIDDDEEEEVEA